MKEKVLPPWAALILDEIDDDEVAWQLVDSLASVKPILVQVASHSFRTSASKAKTRRAFEKSLKLAIKFQESLEEAKVDGEVYLGMAAGLEEAHIERESGKEFSVDSLLQWLGPQLDFTILILDRVVQLLARGRGHPANNKRDMIVGTIAVAFREEAPEIERSHVHSTLFYRVTSMFLDDMDIYEDQLSRAVKRLSEQGRLA